MTFREEGSRAMDGAPIRRIDNVRAAPRAV